MKSLVLIVSIVAMTFAGWTNQTDLLKGPRVVVKSGKGTTKLADLSQHKPIVLTITKKASTRWIVTVPAKSTFTITRNGKPFKSVEMALGNHVAKLQLEPGTYSIASTAGGTLKLMKFKKVKLYSLAPADGGMPVPVSNGKRAYTYFKVGGGVNPVLKVSGSTSAKIFVRVPSKAKTTKIDLTVFEGTRVVSHRIETVKQSDKLFIVNQTYGNKASIALPQAKQSVPMGEKLTDAVVIEFKVPEGAHEYKVVLNGGATGITKFYRTSIVKTASTSKKGTKKPVKKDPKKK